MLSEIGSMSGVLAALGGAGISASSSVRSRPTGSGRDTLRAARYSAPLATATATPPAPIS
ncbi:MAG TPA: hypothetical protein VN767_23935 [Streptosporangiaceae bacterium]|nr:hypothetical protein [Streptosporangiaceae bacterium]